MQFVRVLSMEVAVELREDSSSPPVGESLKVGEEFVTHKGAEMFLESITASE